MLSSLSGRQRRDGSNELALGILGVGNIGMVHLGSALAMDGVDVVAAADAVPANRERAEAAGVDRTYDDFEACLGVEGLDAAVVALPPFLHRDAVERAAEEDVDLFVEKPFARSVDEADEMLELADAAGVSIGVDHTIRYQPDVRRLKGAYEDGRVGQVSYASFTRINDGPLGRPPVESPPATWPLDPDAAGGGVLLELGVHLFDVLTWLFGPLTVQWATTDATMELPVEDAATVLLRAPETGTTITMHCGSYQWEELPDVNTSLRLEGVTGTLENDDFLPANFYASAASSAAKNVLRRFTGDEPDVYAPTFYLQAHYEALGAFVEAVRADEQPPVDGRQGRQCVALAERAYDLASETEAADDPVRPSPEVQR